MKPVEQTILHPILGNCYAACVASLFEVELSAVPHMAQEKGESTESWALYEERLQRDFFGPRGLVTLTLSAKECYSGFVPRGYSVLSAMSPRGDFEHAVVCKDGDIVWDPHPQRHMGVGEKVLWIVFLVLDPAAQVTRGEMV